jgi:hypothetical protein
MIVASDVITQVQRVLGTCDPEYTYDVLTRAIELLANKPTKTSVLWDPLLVYLDVPVVNGYYICLPQHVQKPIKININKQPAFTRNQFFEFTMNGPGSQDPESGWSWQDRGWRPLQKPWPPSGNNIFINSSEAADNALQVLVHAVNEDGSTSWITVQIGTAGPFIYGILEASKPVTQGILSVYASQYIIQSALVAQWQPADLCPWFEWIKLSQTGVSAKILARRRTYAITQPTDIIPLSNRQAIITACIAIKAYDTLNWDDGATAEQNALRFLDEDQGARNLFQRVSNIAETMPILNLTIGTRDVLTVADLYDAACDIFGPIGQPKLFDKFTEAIELMSNMSNWDPLIGYVDIVTWDSFYLTLPQYVDQVLAINVNKSTGSFRNQWFEFSMDGLGQDNDNADSVGSNRPCGGWEEVGEMPCAFPLWAPSYIVATPVNGVDDNTPIRVYGIDVNDLPIYSKTDRNLGARITCEQNSFDISDQQLPFKRIDRVVIGEPQSFIQLYATDGTQYLQYLGIFWPNVAEPRFRVIKIGQKAVTVRLRYKKRWIKITALTDLLQVRSRSAVLDTLRSIQTGMQDPQSAALLRASAKTLLNAEWRATHPHEELQLQIDPATWGSSMINMPALCPFLLLSSVQGLFPIGSPTHVPWFIAAIVVYALKGQPWIRRFTHVAIECFKRGLPFRAHFDSTRLIVANVVGFLGAFGAQLHVNPRSINLRFGHSVGHSSGSQDLSSQASATFCGPASQCMARQSNLFTAIANAKPNSPPINRGALFHYDKAVEPLSEQVNSRAHPGSDFILVGVAH